MKEMILKRHYSDVLMNLCESEQLSDITVAGLVKASGLSRQTFYNHFGKFDDLVCFCAVRTTMDSPYSPFDPRGLEEAGRFAMAHGGFFSQLPAYGKCGFHDRFFKWITKKAHDVFSPEQSTAEEDVERAVQLGLFFNGAYDVFSAWSAAGFKVQPNILARATADMMPLFMRGN